LELGKLLGDLLSGFVDLATWRTHEALLPARGGLWLKQALAKSWRIAWRRTLPAGALSQ
jgi:hypothetical protein